MAKLNYESLKEHIKLQGNKVKKSGNYIYITFLKNRFYNDKEIDNYTKELKQNFGGNMKVISYNRDHITPILENRYITEAQIRL